MAIVKMKKFTLLTFEYYKSSLLKELQKFEDVHFKNLQKEQFGEMEFLNKDYSNELVNNHETELSKIKFALSKLEPFADKPKGLKALTTLPDSMDYSAFDTYLDTYDYENVYQNIKVYDDKITNAKAEIAKLKAENDGLKTWLKLDISPSELDKMKFVGYLIGTVSKVAADSFRLNAEEKFNTAYVEFLGNVKDDTTVLIVLPSRDIDEALAYFKSLGFSKLSLNFSGIPVDIIKSNDEKTLDLQKLQNESLSNIEKLKDEYDKLQIASDYYESVLERDRACQNFLKTQSVVLVEGWVPDDEINSFKSIVTTVCGKNYYLEESDVPRDSDDVPIKLKNNKLVTNFEDITIMFSMPKYNEFDPTPLLTPFYMLFFGFMLGDVGQGLLLLLGTSLALKFVNLKDGMKRFVKFFFYLSFTTIFAGFIYGSFFSFAFFTPIQTADGTYKAILDSQADVITMMLLSVAVGVIHVLFGIGAKGYMLLRDGKFFSAIFDSLFWITTLLSGIAALLGAAGVLSGTMVTVSWWIFVLSIIGLAATQGRESPSLGGKIGSGLYAVYGLSGYVGDLVSYTRITALALSGAYIGFSFNLMAELVPQGFLRFVFGGIIIVFGQLINFGLSALGAYVHTCRLQYVEFFGKFYEGGGIPFKAFKLKNKFINIRK